MVEKDVILHQILTDLSGDGFFSKNFVFKGGTCLIKQHLGYFRFSEDADFTWRRPSRFEGMSTKKMRRELSPIIDAVGGTLEGISAGRGLDFACSKDDPRYVEVGGSNKMCTFKMWYDSAVLGRRSFVKVQVNFVEEICTRPTKGRLKSLASGYGDSRKAEEARFLFPEYEEYSREIPFDVYGIGEILSEKIRAMITRRGVKARDYLDAFFIRREAGIGPADVEECVMRKTAHALDHYAKYRRNLEAKRGKMMEGGALFSRGVERELLLTEINGAEFQRETEELARYLEVLIGRFHT